jgi:hypothetical protein
MRQLSFDYENLGEFAANYGCGYMQIIQRDVKAR